MESFRCAGVRVDAVGPQQARDLLLDRVGPGRRAGAAHLLNAWTLALADGDPRLRALLDAGDLNFADGMPLVWIGRRRGHLGMDTSVYGPQLLLDTVEAGRETGARHYLYGSTEQVVTAMAENLRRRFPGALVVGVESPPFRSLTDDEADALVERLRQAGPDLVWVGLGTPRQDEFVAAFRDRVPATLVPVGAAFDFIGGAVRQAPAWLREAGLEWLFRLVTEPRRLWRRYLVGNVVFLRAVARDARSTR